MCVSVYVRFLSLLVRPPYVYVSLYMYIDGVYITSGYVGSVIEPMLNLSVSVCRLVDIHCHSALKKTQIKEK